MHPTLTKTAASANAAQRRIERVADLLAKLMQDIHGDEWRVDISHECDAEMVIITPRPGRHRRKPVAPTPEVA